MTWRERTLGEGIHIKHGYAFKSKFFSDSGEYIVLTPGNFYEEGGFRFRPSKDRFYDGDIPEDYILSKDDLIVAMTEQAEGLLGSSALIPQDNKYLHNQRLGLLDQIQSDIFDKYFLYYLFNTRSVRYQISGSASGTKVRHTSPERIYRVSVKVPDVKTQNKIADILSKYDDLIENNRRRIELLEESARLLYREWFVHLRFPSHEHTPIIDGVPEGWEKVPFTSVADFINGFPFKPHHLESAGLPIVKIPELKNGITSKTPYNSGEIVPKKNYLDTGDIIFSWSGTLAVNIWNSGKALLNQHLFKVVPKDEKNKSYVYLGLCHSIPLFENETTGSTMRHIRRSALDKVNLIIPPKLLLEEFASLIDPIILYPKFQRYIFKIKNYLKPVIFFYHV